MRVIDIENIVTNMKDDAPLRPALRGGLSRQDQLRRGEHFNEQGAKAHRLPDGPERLG